MATTCSRPAAENRERASGMAAFRCVFLRAFDWRRTCTRISRSATRRSLATVLVAAHPTPPALSASATWATLLASPCPARHDARGETGIRDSFWRPPCQRDTISAALATNSRCRWLRLIVGGPPKLPRWRRDDQVTGAAPRAQRRVYGTT